jgi:hypothetical protein
LHWQSDAKGSNFADNKTTTSNGKENLQLRQFQNTEETIAVTAS